MGGNQSFSMTVRAVDGIPVRTPGVNEASVNFQVPSGETVSHNYDEAAALRWVLQRRENQPQTSTHSVQAD